MFTNRFDRVLAVVVVSGLSILGIGELIARLDEPMPLLFWLPTLWGGPDPSRRLSRDRERPTVQDPGCCRLRSRADTDDVDTGHARVAADAGNQNARRRASRRGVAWSTVSLSYPQTAPYLR